MLASMRARAQDKAPGGASRADSREQVTDRFESPELAKLRRALARLHFAAEPEPAGGGGLIAARGRHTPNESPTMDSVRRDWRAEYQRQVDRVAELAKRIEDQLQRGG